MNKWLVIFLCYLPFNIASAIPDDAVFKSGKTLHSVLERFRLDPNHEFPDAPYYGVAKPTPLGTYNSPVSKRVTAYTDLIKCSDGSYLLFGQGENILQILLTRHRVYALQLSCAMHCRLSSAPNKTYQVFVEQNGKVTQLRYSIPRLRKQCSHYAAAMPVKIAVNLGEDAVAEKPWQILQLSFDPLQEEYRLYYWRQRTRFS